MCFIKGLDTSGVAIGTMHDFGQAALPFGYLACAGAAVSRTTYAKLFAAVGTTFGVGDGSTTFNLPNKIGKTSIMPGLYFDNYGDGPYGVTRVAGTSLGTEQHRLTSAQMPLHAHTQTQNTTGSGSNYNLGGSNANATPVNSTNSTANAGNGDAHNNMQPTLVVGNIGIAYI